MQVSGLSDYWAKQKKNEELKKSKPKEIRVDNVVKEPWMDHAKKLQMIMIRNSEKAISKWFLVFWRIRVQERNARRELEVKMKGKSLAEGRESKKESEEVNKETSLALNIGPDYGDK